MDVRRQVAVSALISVFALACGEEVAPADEFSLRVKVDPEADVSSSVVGVAWAQTDQPMQLRDMDGDLVSMGESLLTLPKSLAPSATTSVSTEQGAYGLSIGHVVLLDRDHAATVDRFPVFAPVSAGDGERNRADFWCEDSCEDIWCDGGVCYREDYECDAPFDGCRLVSTEGSPRLKHPYGATKGIAKDWVVFHAPQDIPAGVLDSIGLHLGPLEAGYHLARVEILQGKDREASKDCWKRAVRAAVDRVNQEDGTDFTDADDVYERGSTDQGGQLAGGARVIGLSELKCPLPHKTFDLVDPAAVKLEVGSDPAVDPTFDPAELPIYLGIEAQGLDLDALAAAQ